MKAYRESLNQYPQIFKTAMIIRCYAWGRKY